MTEKFKPILISLGKGLVKAGSSEVTKYFLANGGKKVNKTIAQNMAKENPYAKNPMTVRTIRNAQNIVDMRSVDTKGKSIKQISKKMDSIRSGGGRAAGISSALGRTPKSLLKNKLMPKT